MLTVSMPYTPGSIMAHFMLITTRTTSGPWTDVSFHLRGDMEDVSFGASSRNGLIQPWAHGPDPSTNLSGMGSASWTGRLLGFTSNSESLTGATDLTINLSTLRGRIDFSGLEHWGVNAAPGPIGSGTMWNDGDLRYGVIVRGNTFIQSGGDAGEVTGAFFGARHGRNGRCRREKRYVRRIRWNAIEKCLKIHTLIIRENQMRNNNRFSQKAFTVLLSLALILPGCGGGGGGGGGSSFPRQPALIPAQAVNAPITAFRDGVQVGAADRPPLDNLSRSGAHGRVAISAGHIRDGESAVRVNDYLGKQAVVGFTSDPGVSYLHNFRLKPTVSIRQTTRDIYVDQIVRTVQLINSALPYDKRITVSSEHAPRPALGDSHYIPDGPDIRWHRTAGRMAPGRNTTCVSSWCGILRRTFRWRAGFLYLGKYRYSKDNESSEEGVGSRDTSRARFS